ncbi:MAG: TetR/AcrR family transcriptional regulator [Eubacteriales bacterium]|nr:TetR/AcrR family transcriptional regulator [Eubacteriales bacterium]
MAKADHSIDPRILRSAREEFLKNGFEMASLKAICEKAEVTTGALYKRYRGKEELFCAAVADTVADLNAVLAEKSALDPSLLTDRQLIEAWNMDEDYVMWWFQFLYDRHDDFVLLLTGAQGTRYADFRHDWAAKMTEATCGFYLETKKRGLTSCELSTDELHVLLSAFWVTIYEPFIHGFSWEQIKAHCRIICRLFDWYSVFGFPKDM